MMKELNSFLLKSLLLCIFSFGLYGCEKDESSFEGGNSTPSKNVSVPTFDKYLTTTTTNGFSIRLRFTNGGDDRGNMNCTVYWRAYPKKPSSTPSARDLTMCEQMRIYDHTKTKTTFDKTHAGYSGGTYIYYYAECRNSKGSCKTSVNYAIIKR